MQKKTKAGKRTRLETLLDLLIIAAGIVLIISIAYLIGRLNSNDAIFEEDDLYRTVERQDYNETISYYYNGYAFLDEEEHPDEKKFGPVADYARLYALDQAYEKAGEGDTDQGAGLRKKTDAAWEDLEGSEFRAEGSKIEERLETTP